MIDIIVFSQDIGISNI